MLRKRNIVVSLVLIVILVIGILFFAERSSVFGVFSSLADSYTECAITKDIRPNEMMLYGEVQKVNTSDPEWLVTTIQLCPDAGSTATVKVYTPTAPNLFYFGKQTVVRDKESYVWEYQKIETFSDAVKVGDTVVISAEDLVSESAVRSRYTSLQDFNCEEQSICYPLVTFVSTHGADSAQFFKNVTTKNGLSLKVNQFLGKNESLT